MGTVLFLVVFVSLIVLGIVTSRGNSVGRTLVSKHDEVYLLPPGALPGAGGAPTRRATADDMRAPVAVRFEPPAGVLPEQVGILRHGKVQSSDIAAAMMALAVDGYLHLAPEERPRSRFRRAGRTWRLTALKRVDEKLNPVRATLLQTIIDVGRPVLLDELKPKLTKVVPDLRESLAAWPQHETWFPNMSGGKVPLSKCITTAGNRQRTGLGTALRYQTAGFSTFLETADGNQLRFEEGAGWFSRYLPWAVALGVTHQWVRAFRQAAEDLDQDLQVVWYNDLAWYGDFGSCDAEAFDGLGDGIGSMMDSLGDALADLESGINDLASDLTDAGDSGGGDGGGGGD